MIKIKVFNDSHHYEEFHTVVSCLKIRMDKSAEKKMYITVNDTAKISEVQDNFNKIFPYLKLEFFSRPHKTGGGSEKKYLKQVSKSLSECGMDKPVSKIHLSPHMTVAELERQFRDLCGLFVQVFRRSGTIWLETSVTDHWTLEEQNKEGEAITLFFVQEKREEKE